MKNLILVAFIINILAIITCSVSVAMNIMTGNLLMAAILATLAMLNAVLAIENFNRLRNLK